MIRYTVHSTCSRWGAPFSSFQSGPYEGDRCILTWSTPQLKGSDLPAYETRYLCGMGGYDDLTARVSEVGVCRGSDTQLFSWGILLSLSPLGKLNTYSHANYMQHVLRCWERQSDGSEYKKTLRRPGLCPGPRWGLQRSRAPPSWWGGASCPLPKNPIPALGPSGLASPTPHSKISSDAVAW